ncbi:hypothetical protein [Mycobacterium sp.]|uniref:hypothetical protein n=1 Tax=Mycobacterium sp. TaxID=1785 RepID=UPI002609CBBF|nr:hypothetical protein [Mycobacterium sp.]
MSHPTYTLDQQRQVCREARDKLRDKMPGKNRWLFFGCAFMDADTLRLIWGKVSKVSPTDAFLTLRSQHGVHVVQTERIVEHTWGEANVSKLMARHGVNLEPVA